MPGYKRLLSGIALSCCVTSYASAQFGPQVQSEPAPTIVAPSSVTAETASAALDARIELGEIKCSLGELGDVLTGKLEEVPVFVDLRAIEMAELSADTMINAKLAKLPLRSAMRRLLHKHGLRVTVEEEGLVVTADFTELTRRGIATDHWVDNSSDVDQEIHAALKKNLTVDFVDTPLDEAITFLGELADVPMHIDSRALEEIGMGNDTPCTLQMNNVRLRSILRLLLREMDLTFMIKDDVLQITTIEAAEQNLVNRIYFLEGTGFPIGDFDRVIQVVQTTVVPDTWEALGGPSTMAPTTGGVGNRPALIISTTSDIHEQIGALLTSLRHTHVGPDPRVKTPLKPDDSAIQPQTGGFF